MFKMIGEITKDCPICEQERELHYGTMHETLKVKKEKIDVTSNIYFCLTGNHYFSDFEEDEKKFDYAYREYRERKGLLQPEDIKAVRKKYDLTQRDLSKILDFGEITIQRYESGAIQDGVHNDSLALILDTSRFRELFTRKKKTLPKRLVDKIENNLRQIDINILNLAFTSRKKASPKLSDSNIYVGTLKEEFQCHNLLDGSTQTREELALAA